MANIISNFIDGSNPSLSTAVSPRKAVIIFGLATKGKMYQRIKITPDTVGEIFGTIPDYTDPAQKDFYNRSLVREAFDLFTLIWDYESQVLQEYDFYGIRIGQSKSATLDIDEMPLKDRFNETLQAVKSITITANEANEEANTWSVIIEGNTSPESITLKCGLVTDTVYFSDSESYDSKTFTNIADAINYFNTVSELRNYVTLSYETVSTNSVIPVTKTGEVINRHYNLFSDAKSGSTFSLHRKIKSIVSASLNGIATYQSESVGLSILYLTKTPIKSTATDTIITSKFVITDEIVYTVPVADIGKGKIADTAPNNVLKYFTDTVYKAAVPNVTFTSVKKISALGVETVITDDSDEDDYYIFTDSTGTIEFINIAGYALGDTYKVSYTYDIDLVEAQTTNDIVLSVKNQYFVYGSEIRFNAALPNIISITYLSSTELSEYSDYTINELTGDLVIQNSLEMVDTDELSFVFNCIPAFPKITAETNLSGGTTDVKLTETAYRDSILKGFNASYGLVARYIQVAGMYVDSTAAIMNAVTGKPEVKLVDYLQRTKDYLTYKNTNVCHCECVIGNKRFEAEDYANLTLAKNNYLANLIAVDAKHYNNMAEATSAFASMFIILAPHMGEKAQPSIRPATMSMYFDSATHILAAKLINSVVNPLGYPIITLNSAPSAIASLAFDTDINIFNRMKSMRYCFAYYYYQLDGTIVIKYFDAPTAANVKSQYRRQGLNAILYDAIDRCRAYIIPHIGKPISDNGIALRLGLNNLMKNYYVNNSILRDAEVTINFVGDTITKEAKIGLKVYSFAELIGAEIETSVDKGEVIEE